ncbi:hypothetical protein JGU71_17695 [Antrihabitans sp. YC3-6]|uniref:Uncharacterized protein n=1 Tax=Antrihabitans stalagmiti TaxID=2799499 RepID=A0A934NSY4_9NOCA|nr:hypothetical protein [Antrihabitans stalagmiti]MBJ8340729.1 hypothetical protein [Antrihabitans stalagmiti]
MSTDRYDTAHVVVNAIALVVPMTLGTVWVARMVDRDQPRHRELTRVCGFLFAATLPIVPEIAAQMRHLSETYLDLANINVVVGRCLVLLAAGEYVTLGGRLSGRPGLVNSARPVSVVAVVLILGIYAITPMRTLPDEGDGIFNVVYGAMAAIASTTVLVAAAWARRRSLDPDLRRSLGALVWASALGAAYGLLAAASANLALIRIVAAASLAALAVAGIRVVLRHQRAA